jgi:phosphoglycolate phosphatase
MVKGLIFDVDGTLVSLKVDGEKLRSTTSRELKEMGFDIGFIDQGTHYTQDIIDTAKSQVDSGSVRIDFDVVRTRLNKALDDLEMDWNAKAELIKGTPDVLEKLRSRSIKLATFTNSGRAPSEWLLRKHGLLGYFDFTLSRDDVPAMKPRADGILKAVSMMKLPKEELLYIGDSVIDIQAAKAADLKIAGVATGRYTVDRLLQEGSDYALGSLDEIFGLL